MVCRREGPLSTQGEFEPLTNVKQRYSSHVRCQLTDVCLQKRHRRNPIVSGRYVCVWQGAKKSRTCVCACACASSRPESHHCALVILVKYIFHTGSCSTCPARQHCRGMWTETRDRVEAHEGQPGSESLTQMELWPFICHS